MSMPLLKTKLYIPALPPRGRWVSRPRLIERLNEGLHSDRKLTLISAPAGFGKTTLVTEWGVTLAGQGLPLAWVLLDQQDNDPVQFWSYLIAALEAVYPGTGERASALLRTVPAPSPDLTSFEAEWLRSVLTALINDLVAAQAGAAAAGSVVLALDDYHSIYTPAIHESLAFLLNYLPAGMHVCILTRADPALPLARLRARGQLAELRASDLRFDTGQVNSLLNQVLDMELPEDAVAALERHTEGWPAGLQLAALSMQGMDSQQARQFIEAFSGTDRNVLSYLREEVLQRQAPEVQIFLMQTSILPYLSAPVCNAVTQRQDSQRILEALAGDNVFTTPLDREGRWYRYHPLFSEALRARLEQTEPGLVPVLHYRAAEWHERQGMLSQAVHHAMSSDDPGQAMRLVEGAYRRLVMRGELVTLRHWLAALPADLVCCRPRLCLAYALALSYSGRYQEIETYLQQAEAALSGVEMEEETSVRGEIAALRAVLASLRWESAEALAFSRQAQHLIPAAQMRKDLWLNVLLHQAQGNAHRLRGELREAGSAYAIALNSAKAMDSPFLVLAVTNRLGQVQLMQGRLHQAAQTLERMLQQVTDQGGELLWCAGELLVNLGEIYREWNDLPQALQQVERGLAFSRQSGNQLGCLAGYELLAKIKIAHAHEEAACQAIQQAEQLALESGASYVRRQVAVHKTWLSLLGSGDRVPGEAVEWAESLATQRGHSSEKKIPPVLHELQDLVLARLRLQQREPEQALRLLRDLEAAAQQAGRTGTMLQSLVLRAMAQRRLGDQSGARESLQRALTLAEPEGYVRLFLDEGEAMEELLAGWRQHTKSVADEARQDLLLYVEKLLAAFDGHSIKAASRAIVQSLGPETLTPRELEILRLMAGGASNQDIATHLVVTVGTVKGHIHHILDKLEARNRTEAVARARASGLLEI